MNIIMQLITDPLTWGMLTFVVVCAWHSFKQGQKQGVLEGVDATLTMLSFQRLIDLEEQPNGEIVIKAKDGTKRYTVSAEEKKNV